MQPEIRKDYIQDKYVIIAPKRGDRPHDIEKPVPQKQYHTPKNCVFCTHSLQNKKAVYIHGTKNKWLTYVIKNDFPAVSLENSLAYGTQEVVIETPNHNRQIDHFEIEHIAALLQTYAQRTKTLEKLPHIGYILIFKNNGGEAGASIQHAHSQIFATRFIPPHLIDKSQKMFEYKLLHGNCVYCDTIEKEIQGPRLVYKDKNVIAFTPYASMHNYEIWIMPRRHLDNITKLNRQEIQSFAAVLKKILKKITQLHLPYNYYFHQVVNDTDQHLYMKIKPRGSVWAGIEIGSGLIINAVSPEDAAEFYRS